MNQQIQPTDEANGNKLTTDSMLRTLLFTVAEEADRVRPGAGNGVRKLAEEKYPEDRPMTCAEQLQHLSNLCERHKRDLLPVPTESICIDCAVELKAKKS